METTIKTVVREVTPDLAKQLLSKNGINRKPIQTKIEHYYQQMRDGKWMLTGQGISISKTGRLLDGQNRLHAVIKYGKGIPMIILYGFDDETFSVYDTGKNRSPGEILYIKGVKSATIIASVIRNYLARKNYSNRNAFSTPKSIGSGNSVYTSNNDVLCEYERTPFTWDEIAYVSNKCYKRLRLLNKGFIGGFIAYMTFDKMYQNELVYQFCYEICGVNDTTCDATALLKDAITRDKFAIKKMDNMTKQAYFNKSWNGFIRKSKMSQLSFKREKEAIPELI